MKRISRAVARRFAQGLLFAWAAGIHAGVTIDGTLSPATTLVGPGYLINQAYGLRAGNNLFHSFGQFSIATGESATFNGSAGIANIIGRVTGGTLSSIDGQIASGIANANLYLINPAGFLFGPNASLNVSGSFYVSSASYLKLSDGSLFHATNPAASTLTSAAPAAFGFLGGNGSVAVNGSRLLVPTGQTLGLAGGDVTVQDGTFAQTLRARSGGIHIASVRSGEAALGTQGFDTSGAGSLGTVTLRGNPASPATVTLEVSEGAVPSGGGTVSIRGGQIVLDGAKVHANTVVANGRQISLSASGDVSINGGAVTALTTGAGNAGALSIAGNNVTISGGALVDTSCDPGCTTGAGGALNVSAANLLRITGNASLGETSGAISNTFGGGASGLVSISGGAIELIGSARVESLSDAGASGNATGVRVNGGSLSLSGGAQVSVNTNTSGQAGTLDVRLSGPLAIDGTGVDLITPGNPILPSGLTANTTGASDGGSIVVSAGSVQVTGAGEISSATFSSGNSGAIQITSGGPVIISGRGTKTTISGNVLGSSGIFANTFGAGNAGTVTIAAPLLQAADGGLIQSQSQGSGNSGNITLNVGSLALSNGGQVSANTKSSGAGGSVIVNATGGVSASGPATGLFSKTYTFGAGGSVVVNAASLDLSNNGAIVASTDGFGAGGSIHIATSNATTLSSGATISSQSAFTGMAGHITVDAGGTLRMVDSSITAKARQADGGNISIRARDLISLNRSQITTEVGTGFGSGGNISIDPTFLVLNSSSIIANAFGGNGGNITIVADNFFKSYDSIVSASSRLGAPGTIDISSPIMDVTGSLADLPAPYLSAASLLANPCAARLAGKSSSLVIARRGGAPFGGDGYLPGFANLADTPVANTPSTPRPDRLLTTNGRFPLSCGST